ncbi:MAG TPA: ABC transporter substrate-binding protein [Tepidisphaeraceae bacterium]|nr:ABC transporter substrate-binding protein [Tepidisphaeraceae bacterium]
MDRRIGKYLAWALVTVAIAAGCDRAADPAKEARLPVRLGYFGNLTHAQAVLGVESGEFAAAIAPAPLQTHVFNAGPSLIEALLAGDIDVGYVGPGPALNANDVTRGRGIRVVSGAAADGVVIVARRGSGITRLSDLAGRKIATPQHGNTQDIAARYYLQHTLGESDLSNVVPIPNSEQSGLMARGQIDAAWSPEPWGSRLIAENPGATLIAQEKDLWPGGHFALTLVITTPEFLRDRPDVLSRLLAVHQRWTERLQADPMRYLPMLQTALGKLNGKKLPLPVLAAAIRRVRFTDDPMESTVRTMGQMAYDLGFAHRPVNIATMFDVQLPGNATAVAPTPSLFQGEGWGEGPAALNNHEALDAAARPDPRPSPPLGRGREQSLAEAAP